MCEQYSISTLIDTLRTAHYFNSLHVCNSSVMPHTTLVTQVQMEQLCSYELQRINTSTLTYTNNALHIHSLKSLSLARAWSTLEAPMRLERAADSVTENTPMVIISGRELMYWRFRDTLNKALIETACT